MKTTVPFVQMVGDIGHKISVATLGFAHHAVFVIAKIRGAQPQRAAFFVRMAHFGQTRNGLLNRARGVERGLQKIVIKLHAKCLQIQILLATQIRHRKIPHCVQIVDVFLRGHAVDRLARKIRLGDVNDVIAAITALRKGRIVHAQTLATRLHRNRQVGNLLTRVIVIKLTVHIKTLTAEYRAENIAQCGLTRMTDVQRPCWVGRDKLEQYMLTAMRIGQTEGRALLNHRLHHRLLGGIGQADIDKPRPCNFQRSNQRIGGHRIDDVLRQLTWVFAQRFGQLHRDIARRIAVRRLLRALQNRHDCGLGGNGFQGRNKTIGNLCADVAEHNGGQYG